MFLFISMEFIAFPSREDAIFKNADCQPIVTSSGNLGLHYRGKCNPTYPNETLQESEKYDWCSNLARDENDHPWISFSFPNKMMKLKGYSLRNGCCFYDCCCDPETGRFIDDHCCCELYDFSLQASNDNHTWKVIHQVQRDQDRIRFCEFRTFEFPMTEAFQFFRIVQDKEEPGCLKCMQINQIEFYGETINSLPFFIGNEYEDNEESVSIIGKVKRY